VIVVIIAVIILVVVLAVVIIYVIRNNNRNPAPYKVSDAQRQGTLNGKGAITAVNNPLFLPNHGGAWDEPDAPHRDEKAFSNPLYSRDVGPSGAARKADPMELDDDDETKRARESGYLDVHAPGSASAGLYDDLAFPQGENTVRKTDE